MTLDLRERYEPVDEDGNVKRGRNDKGFTLGNSNSKVELWRTKDGGRMVAIKFEKTTLNNIMYLHKQFDRSRVCENERPSTLIVVEEMVEDVQPKAERVGLVFPYVEGASTLLSKFEERQPWAEKKAVEYLYQIVRVVEHMHRKGVIHRALAPENVLVAPTSGGKEEGDSVHIINWKRSKRNLGRGISSAPKSRWTWENAYYAPESVSDSAQPGTAYDEKVDVWSCGVLMYQMLCGKQPFYDETDETSDLFTWATNIDKGVEFPREIEISPECKNMITKMLKRSPEERSSSADVLAFLKQLRQTSSERLHDEMSICDRNHDVLELDSDFFYAFSGESCCVRLGEVCCDVHDDILSYLWDEKDGEAQNELLEGMVFDLEDKEAQSQPTSKKPKN